jgi:hypothetical protein
VPEGGRRDSHVSKGTATSVVVPDFVIQCAKYRDGVKHTSASLPCQLTSFGGSGTGVGFLIPRLRLQSMQNQGVSTSFTYSSGIAGS